MYYITLGTYSQYTIRYVILPVTRYLLIMNYSKTSIKQSTKGPEIITAI